jgi:hypothetical protein
MCWSKNEVLQGYEFFRTYRGVIFVHFMFLFVPFDRLLGEETILAQVDVKTMKTAKSDPNNWQNFASATASIVFGKLRSN